MGYLSEWMRGYWGASFGGISSMAVFGIMWFVFNHWLWRRPFARRFLLVPDLNGEWECRGKTIKKDAERIDWPWNGNITIKQSWTKIMIRLQASQSGSKSIAASLYHEGDGRYRMIYHYENEPKVSETELRRHSGLTVLLFDSQAESAEGRYFTDGDRLTVGEMHLQRKEETIGPANKT